MKSASKLKRAFVALAVVVELLTGVHYWQEERDKERASVSLLAAARAGDRTSVLIFLDVGGSPNVQDDRRQTPLMLAAERGDIDMACTLLDGGADVRLKDTRGGTALMRAVASGNVLLVELLIFWKADVNARRADGATALTLARQEQAAATPQQVDRMRQIVRMLLQARAHE